MHKKIQPATYLAFLNKENQTSGNLDKKTRKGELKMGVKGTNCLLDLHVHSWHGTAHGVWRRPHATVVLRHEIKKQNYYEPECGLQS